MRFASVLLSLCVGSTAFAQSDVPFITVTSKDRHNSIEWQNPASGPYAFTRIIGRDDRFAVAPDDIDLGGFLFVVDVAGELGKSSRLDHPGLTNGTLYFYTAFVSDGAGGFSAGKRARGEPFDNVTGPVKWKLFIGEGAVSMTPPGLGSVILALTNDNNSVYAVTRGPDGGTWPSDFVPVPMGAPADHRLSVLPSNGVVSASNYSLVASNDGVVRAIDADVGGVLWSSASLGMLQAGPSAWLSRFKAPFDYALVGTRVAAANNTFYALDIAANGIVAWSFADAGGDGIGIINGSASVDYKNRRAYFASHEIAAGKPSVWAVDLVTGDKVWSTPLGNISGAAVQRGDTVYVGNDSGLIYGLHIDDGLVKLNFPFDTKDGATRGFVFPDFSSDSLFVSTQTKVWRLRDVEPVVIDEWSHPGIPDPSIPLYPSGSRFLWVGSSDGHLYQLDVTTGNPVTAPDTKSLLLATGAGVGTPSYDVLHRLIYIGTEDGILLAIAAPF